MAKIMTMRFNSQK